MIGDGCVPLAVTQENIADFEKDTGFIGIGRRMLRAGVWRLADGDGDRNVTRNDKC